VAYLVKAQSVKFAKDPLLQNGRKTRDDVIKQAYIVTNQQSKDPCEGGLESLHRIPASSKRRQKGNPVRGGITRPPCSWGLQIWGSGPPG
jgi:hypothetical protein